MYYWELTRQKLADRLETTLQRCSRRIIRSFTARQASRSRRAP